MEVEWFGDGHFRHIRECNWDQVITRAAAIRRLREIDFQGFTAVYEVDQGESWGGGTRQYLVAEVDRRS